MISVEEIRQSMLIKHNKFDSGIKRYVDTCLQDMQMAGVNIKKESNLLDTACEFYCKWQFDYMGQGERYEKEYEALRDTMSLSGLYNGEESDENRTDQTDSSGENAEQ
ncbi:hypothetical protein [Waltera acetigignens]|nr:MAG TPA: hypothetical protein [Caudoviricetes sp.]